MLKTDKTIFRPLLFLGSACSANNRHGNIRRRITCTFNWTRRATFSPGRKDTPFSSSDSTSAHIHQFDTTKSIRLAKTPPVLTLLRTRKNTSSLFLHGRRQAPFHLPCPTSHSPRTFNGTATPYATHPLCTRRQIYDTARAMPMYRRALDSCPPS